MAHPWPAEAAGGQERSLQTPKPAGDARGWKTKLGLVPYNEQSPPNKSLHSTGGACTWTQELTSHCAISDSFFIEKRAQASYRGVVNGLQTHLQLDEPNPILDI